MEKNVGRSTYRKYRRILDQDAVGRVTTMPERMEGSKNKIERTTLKNRKISDLSTVPVRRL